MVSEKPFQLLALTRAKVNREAFSISSLPARLDHYRRVHLSSERTCFFRLYLFI